MKEKEIYVILRRKEKNRKGKEEEGKKENKERQRHANIKKGKKNRYKKLIYTTPVKRISDIISGMIKFPPPFNSHFFNGSYSLSLN